MRVTGDAPREKPAEDDFLMQESRKELAEKLMLGMGIDDVVNPEQASGIIITALATISQVLNGTGLETLVRDIDFPCASVLAKLPRKEFASLGNLVEARQESLLENEIHDHQMIVQRLISSPKRKRLAIYYTRPIASEFMARLAAHFVRTRDSVVLADPFIGSGLTISAALKRLDPLKVKKVWGVEPHPLPAIVAYSAILHLLKGEHKKIHVTVGDVFRNALSGMPRHSKSPKEVEEGSTSKADIIIANPPFTRWELLEGNYRSLLWDLTENLGCSKYVTRKQLNLQAASLFMMDHLLEDDGLLMSVLPASTFYTLYGEAARALLNERYQLRALVENKSDTSFSVDSGLKEVILVATKPRPTEPNKTAFVTLDSDAPDRIQKIAETLDGLGSVKDGITWVDLAQRLPLAEANWSVFFANSKLTETLSRILSKGTKNGTIGIWSNIYGSRSIIRGVEMYGPDFFFIPNRSWRIVGERIGTVTVENSEDQIRLDISREYLVPALRKPGLYLDTIRPDVNHYLLSIPSVPVKELEEGPAKYITWGKRKLAAQPAIKTFGDRWYSHVNRQMRVKKPFGRVFLPDKVDPTFQNRGIFASHSQTPLVASKNFHIVSLDDDSKDKMLTLWFNGALFFLYFIIAGRRITKSWSRLVEDNYLRMPIVDLNLIGKRDVIELEKVFENLLNERLPPLKRQLTMEYRRRIDRTLLRVIGVDSVDEDLERVYSALEPNLR